jgi:hypothetical protein
MDNKNKIVIFILIILFSPIISADVISINSGGSNVIVLNPDTYIEGFFGCVSTTCAKLGYECDSWPDGCGKTLDCGPCPSGYTCTAGTCVEDVVTPPSGGNGAVTPTPSIAVTPTSINLNLAINTNKEQVINVKNLKSTPTTVSISQTGLTNMVILGNTSLTLAGGETKKFSVIFVALNKTGIFTGTINVGTVKIPVSLNVKTKLLLFDSNIVVLNRDYKVSQGTDLRTRVTLIPMGDSERLDVTLNYVIKDYSGKIYLTQSETVLVEKKMNFRKNFGTGSLPLGKYIVGLELVYPGGVAPSSAHFEIVEKTATDFLGRIIFILMLAILILGILIIILIIRRRKKQEATEVQ